MSAPVIQPLIYDAPLVNPSPNGLYEVTAWTETVGPPRWLHEGVQLRTWNYGGEAAFGVWTEPWCAETDSDSELLKTGTRPDDGDPFSPITVWSYDSCDLTAPSRDEVRARAQQTMRLQEQTAVETEFATRLLADAGVIVGVPTLREAVAYLEAELAKTNTVGVLHAGAQWASRDDTVVFANGPGLRTRFGHRWAFGGGYVDGLDDVIVATSPVYGWRDAVTVRESVDAQQNVFAAVAERSVILSYERLVAAVTVQDAP